MLPKFCPISQGSSSDTGHTTPGANGTNGDGTGSGDGTTDGGTTDVTPTTYADGTNGTAKSAVSTGDESPIGTYAGSCYCFCSCRWLCTDKKT